MDEPQIAWYVVLAGALALAASLSLAIPRHRFSSLAALGLLALAATVLASGSEQTVPVDVLLVLIFFGLAIASTSFGKRRSSDGTK